MMGILELESVSRRFGDVAALSDVSLSVHAGETLALIGHNGAGKTTLFRLVLGFLLPHAGRVTVNGHAPGHAEAQRRVAYLPESVAFPKTLTGEEVVCFYARLRGASKAAAMDALDRVDLMDARYRRCGGYSKGMRQRLGLAQALVGSPELLLLDEPTSGLDPSSRHSIYALLDEIASNGAAVVLSSHGLNELESHSRRVVMLSDGCLVAEGSVDALLARAGLPLVVLARSGSIPAQKLAQLVGGRVLDDDRIEVRCAPQDKMNLLRQMLDSDNALTDLEFRVPGLDELYRHFASRELTATEDVEA